MQIYNISYFRKDGIFISINIWILLVSADNKSDTGLLILEHYPSIIMAITWPCREPTKLLFGQVIFSLLVCQELKVGRCGNLFKVIRIFWKILIMWWQGILHRFHCPWVKRCAVHSFDAVGKNRQHRYVGSTLSHYIAIWLHFVIYSVCKITLMACATVILSMLQNGDKGGSINYCLSHNPPLRWNKDCQIWILQSF